MRYPARLLSPKLKRGAFSGCRRLYHDPTLLWAKENPQVAQACLQPPKANIPLPELNSKLESLESYCQWRRWPHSSPTSELHENAMAISSHVLSAPLTLASFYAQCNFSKTIARFLVSGTKAISVIWENSAPTGVKLTGICKFLSSFD